MWQMMNKFLALGALLAAVMTSQAELNEEEFTSGSGMGGTGHSDIPELFDLPDIPIPSAIPDVPETIGLDSFNDVDELASPVEMPEESMP